MAENPVSRLLATPAMVRIGDWSYSLYLWHWPFIVFFRESFPGWPSAALVGAVVAVIPALLSYRFVEQPSRTMASPRTPAAAVRRIGLVLAAPIVAALVLWVGGGHGWGLSWPPSDDDHAAMKRGCVDSQFDPAKCRWSAGGSGAGEVLLAGDSQAYSLADGVIAAGRALSLDTVVTSRSGCPFANVDTSGTKTLDCPSWQHEVLAYALEHHPVAVIIANRSAGYTNPEAKWRKVLDPSGEPVVDARAATSTYAAGLADFVTRLADAGIRTVVVQNIPEPEHLARLTLMSRWLGLTGPASFDASRTVQSRDMVAHAELTIAPGAKGVAIYDPMTALCDGLSSPLKLGSSPAYIDTFHLSRQAALQLAPGLKAAISGCPASSATDCPSAHAGRK
jgi:hypothetical protein